MKVKQLQFDLLVAKMAPPSNKRGMLPCQQVNPVPPPPGYQRTPGGLLALDSAIQVGTLDYNLSNGWRK